MDQLWDSSAINELLFALEEEWPDPVDVFEDDLAEAMGVFRFPTLSYANWRRLRVRGINAATGDSEGGTDLTWPARL